MSSKYTGKLWLLESNQERVFDEFGDRENTLIGQYPVIKAKKTLLSTKTTDGNKLMPQDMYPVALVFEHHNEGEQYPDGGLHDVYASPLFGHELLQQLEGRLLDYVDATYADVEQRKSQKRILRRILWEYRKQVSDANLNKFKFAEEAKNKSK